MARTRTWHGVASAFLLACSGNITGPGGTTPGGGNGGGGPGGTVGGTAADEQFPPALLQPYTGPANTAYDNTFVGYQQLKGKVKAVFGDDWVRGGTDKFAANIGLLGGADFTSHYVEARVATSDFLLALDSLSKDVCSQAVGAKTGPFAGLDVAASVVDDGSSGTTRETAARASIAQLHQRLLFRAPTAAESDAAYALLKDLLGFAVGPEPQDAWSGVCEALVKHPDFLWTLPPSRPQTTGAENKTLLLVKVAQDLVARPPTAAEIQAFTTGGKTLDQMVDAYLASPEWRTYAYYKMRIRTESDGTPDSDEPARLWTRVLTTGDSYTDLLTGDYGVDTSFQKVSRSAEHGKTGVLTMKGYIQHKPGLPHYNYPARVLGDFMGYIFEVPPEVIAMRIGATASSTVDPNTICFTCHQLLTPLAYQRARWDDDGNYVTVGTDGKSIDDSDRGLVGAYPYKGQGMEAFATQAVKKERFVRQTLQAESYLLLGRQLRYDQDERTLYKQLWDTLGASKGDLRATLKVLIASPQYQGK